MALIAIEEHWNLSTPTSAVRALPEDRGDASVLFDDIGDANLTLLRHALAVTTTDRLLFSTDYLFGISLSTVRNGQQQ